MSGFQDIDATLKKLNFKPDNRHKGATRYTGELQVGHRRVQVALDFEDAEFISFPKLYLISGEDGVEGIVAHRDGDQYCYAQDGVEILDASDIPGTVAYCLERARRSLLHVLSGTDLSKEIALEFAQHWQAKYKFQADLRMRLSGKGKLVTRYGAQLLEDRQYLKGEPEGTPAWIECVTQDITFPFGHRAPNNLREFFAWADAISAGMGARLAGKLAEGFPKNLPMLVVRAPNAIVAVDVELTAVQLHASARPDFFRDQILAHGEEYAIRRFVGERADSNYIYSRNQEQNLFAEKTVAVIGCGTIGSHVAKFLAQSGAGSQKGTLALLDYQTFTAANIGRHYLGINSLNKLKSVALKDELMRELPDLNIRPLDGKIQANFAAFDSYDIVIDATGDEGVSNAINRHYVGLRKSGAKYPAVVHVWLEGRGEAAQALLITGPEDACYQCLSPGERRFSPLEKGYAGEVLPGTCNDGTYMPYGVGSSAIAAGLASAMVTDLLKGTTYPKLRTVLIGHTHTRKVKDQNPTRSAQCKACGHLHGV